MNPSENLHDESLKVFFIRLSRIWSRSAIFIYVFILIQNLTGNFGDKSYQSWFWIFLNTFPVITLLITLGSKTGSEKTTRGAEPLTGYAKTLSWLILVLLVVIILAEPVANYLLQITILDVYIKSYFLLIPLQIMLITTLLLIFKRQK